MKRYPEESLERYEKLKAAIENLPAGTKLPSADDTSTELNDLKLVTVLAGKTKNNAGADVEESDSTAVRINTLAKKIGNSTSQALAAIQYLSATTDVPEATKALKHEAFKNVSIGDLMSAYAGVTKVMKDTDLSNAEVKSFIALLLDRAKITT